MFEASVAEKYRVVRTQHGKGEDEAEHTIPLGSWRKGGGLAGSRGHAYEYGPDWAGVWIKGFNPEARITGLAVQFPNVRIMQVGDREATFRVPMTDLDRILPLLKAKRRFKASEAALATLEKARAASPIARRAPRGLKRF